MLQTKNKNLINAEIAILKLSREMNLCFRALDVYIRIFCDNELSCLCIGSTFLETVVKDHLGRENRHLSIFSHISVQN